MLLSVELPVPDDLFTFEKSSDGRIVCRNARVPHAHGVGESRQKALVSFKVAAEAHALVEAARVFNMALATG
jgi:hypothetical protein